MREYGGLSAELDRSGLLNVSCAELGDGAGEEFKAAEMLAAGKGAWGLGLEMQGSSIEACARP
jgi:hypothetical protein